LHPLRKLPCSLRISRYAHLLAGSPCPFAAAFLERGLWDGLHHQGDVGVASYAAVPQLLRIYRKRGVIDWNTYAMVAVIELARDDGKNPKLPKWLEEEYFQAIQELAELGAIEVLKTKDPDEIRATLSILAISAGSRTHAWFLLDYSADELLEMKRLAEL
jgi:hypothetical protein